MGRKPGAIAGWGVLGWRQEFILTEAMKTSTHWQVDCLKIDRAQRSLLFSAVLSVPTHRQCTNERHLINDWSPKTKNIVVGLWRFRKHCKTVVKDLQSQPGDFDLSPSSFTRGIHWPFVFR